MDVTPYFLVLVGSAERPEQQQRAASSSSSSSSASVSSRQLIRQSYDIVLQIASQRTAIEMVYEDFIDYHSHLRGHTEVQRSNFDRAKVAGDLTVFITNTIDRVNTIQKVLNEDIDGDTMPQRKKHYTEIINYIFDLLLKLTKMNQKMQSERALVTRSPFTLISDDLFRNESFITDEPVPVTSITISSDVKSIASLIKTQEHQPLDEDFSKVYTDQLGKTLRFDQYNSLTERYKLLLHHENRINKRKFSQELQEARQLEETAGGISGLLSDFVCLLQEQAGQLEALFDESQATVEQVQAADRELVLTIERSNSKQRYMNGFVVGVALLLLLLDFISP